MSLLLKTCSDLEVDGHQDENLLSNIQKKNNNNECVYVWISISIFLEREHKCVEILIIKILGEGNM